MARVCPNKTAPEWEALVAELGNSSIRAMRAFRDNGDIIPDVGSELVQNKKKTNLKIGEAIEIIKDDEGNQTDQYKSLTTGNVFNRISKFVVNFAAKKQDKLRTIPERKADNFWGSKPKDEKMVTEFSIPQTWDEYKNMVQLHTDRAIDRGNLIHLAFKQRLTPSQHDTLQAEIDALESKHMDGEGKLPFSWDWVKEPGVMEAIFDNVGLNYFHNLDTFDDILRDEIMSEISVASEAMGLAGTIDMLVRHSDDTYTVIDWKTGKSLNKVFSGMDSLPMKYGTQPSLEIEDSIRNRAKLQIALYAVLLRAENPGMQFRALSLAWIPNRYDSLERDTDMNVDAWSFIPMIEKFLGDPILLEQAGLPRNIKAMLLEKDANIFNPANYSTAVQARVQRALQNSNLTPEEILKSKMAKLKLMLGGATGMDDLGKEDKKEAFALTDDINSFLVDKGKLVKDAKYEDLSFMELYLGNYSEVTHPIVQSWKKYKDEQEYKVRRSAEPKLAKFRALLRPILSAYDKENSILNIHGNKSYNYDKLFQFAFVDEPLSDETQQTKERMITSTETDPELIDRWNRLTEPQRKLLTYINETFSSYFNGPQAFLQETATLIDGKDVSHIELYNREKETKNRRSWYNGFFFKVQPTDVDIATRNGDGNYWKGKTSRKALGSMIFKYSTFFKEQYFEKWDDPQALPIKYLGSDYIDSSRSYTRNLEIIFHDAVTQMERKKHMDGVFALGLAIKTKLSVEKDPQTGQPMYDNLVNFLDHKLLNDIQRKMKIKDPRSSGRGMRIKMYTPNGWQYEKVSMDAVMKGLTKWASMNTMWVRPFQGVGNGVHAMMLTHRDGLKGSIASVNLMGIEGGSIDFNEADLLRAEGAYFADFLREAQFGDVRKSKMYLFAKEFDYFGNNFDYAQMEATILSLRNRHMGESAMYMFHSLPEEFVSLTTMAAQLMHMKNEKTGKSIWQSYDVEEMEDQDPNAAKKHKEHHLVWKGGVRGIITKGAGDASYTEELTHLNAREQARLRKVHERLQGGYRKDEALIIETYTLGKMVVHLKKYLPRLLLNGMHKLREETDLGYYKKMVDPVTGEPVLVDQNGEEIPMYEWVARITEGRWWTLGRFAIMLGTLGHGYSEYQWNKLHDEQKQNLIEAMLTFAILFGTYAAYAAWFEDMDDDDTRKKWWKMYLMDNLSQQYNIVDLARTLKTAATPVSIAKMSDFTVAGVRMLFAGADYASGNMDEALTKKGDLQGWNRFVKSIPYLSSAKDILNRFDNIKDEDAFLKVGLDTIRLK